ncbi:Postreplication repair E3 ubiquitin-protein ligase RAD18 [Entamoeba marina]
MIIKQIDCLDELMHAAVVLPCQHHYCSLCIRRHLVYKDKCPICRNKTIISNIKPDKELQIKILKETEPNISNEILNNDVPKKYLYARSYKMMKEKNIRKELNEFNVQIKGKRPLLEKFHREFCLMYNAECDAINPLPIKDISNIVTNDAKVYKDSLKPKKNFTDSNSLMKQKQCVKNLIHCIKLKQHSILTQPN